MSKFKQGDYVTIDDAYLDITQGRAYKVNGIKSPWVLVTDDAGDAHSIHTMHCTLVPTKQSAATASGNPFKVGDVVTPNKQVVKAWPKHFIITGQYTITSINGGYVRFHGKGGGFSYGYFTLVHTAGSQAAPVPQPQPDYTAAVLEGADDGLDYDQRKAAASVCSLGRWQQGQVLVYADGTPTMTTLTVKFCTATCVTFEETYSQPFNPDEFEREY